MPNSTNLGSQESAHMGIRAVVYSRVSTDAQERDGTSLDTQEDACVKFALARGWRVVQRLRDTASGYTLDRPNIEELRRLLQLGSVDVVLAYAVDRLARNQNHIGVLFDEVEQAGARLDFVTENFEDTAMGRFILSARAFVAEVEREKISERTMRGKKERARSGRIPQGTGKGIYGYTYDIETGRRQVVEGQAAVVRRIFEEFSVGASCSGVAKELNNQGVPAFSGGLWHPLTVRRILSNETYTGRTTYRRTRVVTSRDIGSGKKVRRVLPQPESEWIDVPNATPALISKEIFAKVQSILNDPTRRLRGQPSHRYRLRGHVRCFACGTPMVGQAHAGGRYLYYRCRRSYAGYFEGKCKSRYVRVEVLERVVLEEVAKVLSDPARIMEEVRRLNGQVSDTEQSKVLDIELQQVEEQQRRLARLYLSGSLPEDLLSVESERLSRRRNSLEAQRTSLNKQSCGSMDLDQLAGKLTEVSEALREWVLRAKDDDIALILRALDLRVRASPEEVQIEGSVPVLESEPEDLVTIVQTSA